ncbi:MAG TPA: hypothetical protein VMA35_14985 [Candidatus Sulfopaludibacter sp.]|nr:hypothetical protein [Candidatus Sulfopaludibacter sp.]
MMPPLHFIFPPGNAVASADDGGAPDGPAPSETGEHFGHLMTQMLSAGPRKSAAAAAQSDEGWVASGGTSRLPTPVARYPSRFSSKNTKTDATLAGRNENKSGNPKSSTSCPTDGAINAVALNLQGTILPIAVPVLAGVSPVSAPVAENKKESAAKTVAFIAEIPAKGETVPGAQAGNPARQTIPGVQEPGPAGSPLIGDRGASPKKTLPSDKTGSPAGPAPGAGQKMAAAPTGLAAGKTISIEPKITEVLAPGNSASAAPALKVFGAEVSGQIAVSEMHPANLAQIASGSETSPGSGGISAAKLDTTMKNAEKTNKIAGPTEKILPGKDVLAAGKNSFPAPGAIPLPQRNKQSETIAAAHLAAADSKAGATAPPNAATNFLVVDPGSRPLERVHDMVALQTIRLQDSGSDSLRVVIKPGAGAQLSLELRQNGDGIDARAVLQRGDFNQLSQHWPELQQRLEQRGIKLAPLINQAGDSEVAGHGGHGGFRQQQQPAEPNSLMTGAFDEFPIVTPKTQSREPVPTAGRGWETWA